MIVTKNVLAVADVVASENTRYAINGARFRRVGDVCQADATDGRMLLRVQWCDDSDRKETPTPESLEFSDVTTGVDGFETIVSADHIKRIGKAIPKRKTHPQLQRAILPEKDVNGRAPFHIADGSAIVDGPTIEGSFPNVDDVIPALDTGAGLTESLAGASVTIGVNPGLLARMCKALQTAATDEESKGVRLTIPVDPNRPMMLTARRTDGTTATGVIMPVQTGDDPSKQYDTLRDCTALVKRIAGALVSSKIGFEPIDADDSAARAQCRELSDLCADALEALEPTTDDESAE